MSRVRITALFILICFILLMSSCAKRLSKFPYPEMVPQNQHSTVKLSTNIGSELDILYLGCGNIIIERNNEAVMFDPFFSNQSVLKLAGKVKPDSKAYARWQKNVEPNIERKDVKAFLVSHTHYDHVMDVPVLLTDNYFSELKNVFGNPYLPTMLQNFKKDNISINSFSNDVVFDPLSKNDTKYNWINITPSIRFLPILSNHAPQRGHTLYMNAPLDSSYFKIHLTNAYSKIKTDKWTCGETYSFLIDFIDRDTVRVFVQTSASEPPYGFPPKEILNNKKVDIALLCYASTLQVDHYPNALYELLKPEKVILVHWEDFFRKSNAQNFKLVRGTDSKKFGERIQSIPNFNSSNWILPKPGTRITFN